MEGVDIMNVVQAIEVLVPGADYKGPYPRDRRTYERLNWKDSRPQPDWTADILPLLPQDVPKPPIPAALRDVSGGGNVSVARFNELLAYLRQPLER